MCPELGLMAQPLLSVRHLSTEFRTERGTVKAVDDVSFDLAAGETLAIVGESGSGKSVTAMSLLRLIPNPPGRITSGEVVFDGKDLLKLDDAAIRAIRGDRIAMIFQEPMSSLNPSLTIGLQIAEPINLHRKTPWAKAMGMAADLLDRVRLPDAKMDKVLLTRDEETRQQMLREMTVEILDKAPYIWLPTPYLYAAWWPWVKNYGAELSVGSIRPGPIYARIWMDQELKKKMGY